ncbi:glycosyltransferase family 2 protein [Nioella ostreopsis]|uniref:glycosyltransferase family 2 protein n=1 Tax=Nioella ostreopsis TaxID=2448479 RepID=UPI000FD90B52|nr:glycosyltransferase family 2 protein [Nioella ostreopsis]
MSGETTIDTTRAKLLEDSVLFDAEWYATRNGDVALAGLDPLDHFLKIGWDLGRSPGPEFDTRAYLACFREVADSGMDALTHYLQYGASEGRAANPFQQDPILRARAKSDVLRNRLNVFGQSSALERLQRLADEETGDAAGFAGRDLALWHLRQWRMTQSPDSATTAGRCAHKALVSATDPSLRSRLLTVALVADALAGQPAPSDEGIRDWQMRDLLCDESWFALAGFEASEIGRLRLINRALAAYGLGELTLCDDTRSLAYDRLTPKRAPQPVDGPLVSVLIAAHQAEDTLPTALRAVADQSWRNLEIIVIDDASSDGTAQVALDAARADPRIQLKRLSQNGGAYAARNAGLAMARGEYVTLHDADDWCHPDRITVQMELMLESGTAIACTSEHVRMHSDLTLTRLSPEASFLTENTASLLFRRQPVVDALGCWDSVRVAADNELIRRIRRVFGPASVISGMTGPLAMLRDREGSAVRTGPLSIDGYVTGARLVYLDAQEHHHRTASVADLHYTEDSRPFPAPGIMKGRDQSSYKLSLVLAADLRHGDWVVETCLKLASLSDGPVGLVPLARPLAPDLLDTSFRLCTRVREVLDGQRLLQLCPGESASAPLLIAPDPEALLELPGSLPELRAESVRLLACYSPVATLPGSGRRLERFDASTCESSARRFTTGPVEWWAGNRAIKQDLIKSGASRVARAKIPFDALHGLLR